MEDFRKVTAIVRCTCLEQVEKRLQESRVKGLTVTHVKGFGEYANFFRRDWAVTHARIEIFTSATRAEEIARTIMDAARTGAPGDGIIAILPVEKVLRIRNGAEATLDELSAGDERGMAGGERWRPACSTTFTASACTSSGRWPSSRKRPA